MMKYEQPMTTLALKPKTMNPAYLELKILSAYSHFTLTNKITDSKTIEHITYSKDIFNDFVLVMFTQRSISY